MNSEFYVGWFILWGDRKHYIPAYRNMATVDEIVANMTFMYSMNASFVLFIVNGGTNFGFWNGAFGNGGPV